MFFYSLLINVDDCASFSKSLPPLRYSLSFLSPLGSRLKCLSVCGAFFLILVYSF